MFTAHPIQDMLKKKGMHRVVQEYYPFFTKVFKGCLKADHEDILIIADHGFFNRMLSPTVGACYYFAAKEIGLNVKLVLQQPKNIGDKADQGILKALSKHAKKNIVMVNVSNKLGSLKPLTPSFRGLMKEKQYKFTSLSGLGSLDNSHLKTIIQNIDINYGKLQSRCKRIKKIFDKGNGLFVTTKAGTDLFMDIRGKTSIANDGNYALPGMGGNMPCGEVYLPPNSTNAQGTIVIDGSIRHRKGTELIHNRPVTLTVRGSKITRVEGGVAADLLEQSLAWAEQNTKWPERVRTLAEFSVGLNPHARILGHTFIDEKTEGTSHIAIGSNKWFGGDVKTNIHVDHVFRSPTVKVDKTVIVKNGRLLC
jgi:hypothetical protein